MLERMKKNINFVSERQRGAFSVCRSGRFYGPKPMYEKAEIIPSNLTQLVLP